MVELTTKEKIFSKLFEQAEVANFTQEQLSSYEESIKIYRDYTNILNTAREEAEAKGRAEGEKKVEQKVKKLEKKGQRSRLPRIC